MKLYLSSYRIPTPKDLFELVGKKPENIRAAIIPNAKDYYTKRARGVRIRDNTAYLKSLSIESEVLDLLDFSNPEELEKTLLKYDMIWVIGGNTFCLRDAMKSSGFETVIPNILDRGVTYVGESAGSCVVGNNLRGLESEDNPEFTETIIWTGLGLVNHFILPHADNESLVEDTARIRELYRNDRSFLALCDDQVLIINGKNEKIVSCKV